MTYAYQPLSEGQIFRILVLEPAETIEQPLVATFSFAGLNTPDFDAVSYTWGSDELSKTIELDGASLPITFNLWNALRHFRLEDESKLLWADGIRINQQDVEEKNAQVSRTSHIYREAQHVLAWLDNGDCVPEIETGLQIINNIASMAPVFGALEHVNHYIKFDAPEPDLKGHPYAINHLYEQVFDKNIDIVFASMWFRRLWIVQEAVLARKLILRSGHAELKWPRFAAAVIMFERAMLMSVRTQVVKHSENFAAVLSLVHIRAERELLVSGSQIPESEVSGAAEVGCDVPVMNGLQKPREYMAEEQKASVDFFRQTLFNHELDEALTVTRPTASGHEVANYHAVTLTGDDSILCSITAATDATSPRIYDTQIYERFDKVLSKLRRRLCTDDRDRVYATLGFRPRRLSLNITPDYSKSVVQVYTDYARQLLEAGKVDVLHRAGIWRRQEYRKMYPAAFLETAIDDDFCPSWVPELRPSRLTSAEDIPTWLTVLENRNWSYCSPQIVWPKASLMKPWANHHSRRVSVEGVVLDSIEYIIQSSPDGIIGLIDAWENVSTGIKLMLEKCPDNQYAIGNEDTIMGAMIRMIQTVTGYDREQTSTIAIHLLRKDFAITSKDLNAEVTTDQIKILTIALRKVLVKWTIVITIRGYLCLLPRPVGQYDILVAFCGLPGPYVVRPVIGTLNFQLVGPCYVHNMMEGRFEYNDNYESISLI